MELHIFPSQKDLLFALARYFKRLADEHIQQHGQFNVALSGGNSPRALYALLASPEFRTQIEWKHVHFFFSDERYVPANDPASNALMARETLFDPLHISEECIHRPDTSLSPTESAIQYQKILEAHFQTNEVRFDLILLGLGDNAHTASLFPLTSVLSELTPAVSAVYVPEIEAYRITFNAPLINMSKQIAFLVYGKNKATAVHQVIQGNRNTNAFPAQLISGADGQVHWFMDESAADLLTLISE